MSKIFGKFFYEFADTPIVVGGRAMQHYGLRDSGDGVDLVVSVKDFHGLYGLYPGRRKVAPLGDTVIKTGVFECYAGFCGLEYPDLLIGAIEQEDHLIAGLPMLLQLAAMCYVRCPYERFRGDIALLVKKLNLVE